MKQSNKSTVVQAQKLPADVSEKYSLVGIKPGRYDIPGYGEVDFTRLTVERADNLVANQFPFLKVKAAKA